MEEEEIIPSMINRGQKKEKKIGGKEIIEEEDNSERDDSEILNELPKQSDTNNEQVNEIVIPIPNLEFENQKNEKINLNQEIHTEVKENIHIQNENIKDFSVQENLNEAIVKEHPDKIENTLNDKKDESIEKINEIEIKDEHVVTLNSHQNLTENKKIIEDNHHNHHHDQIGENVDLIPKKIEDEKIIKNETEHEKDDVKIKETVIQNTIEIASQKIEVEVNVHQNSSEPKIVSVKEEEIEKITHENKEGGINNLKINEFVQKSHDESHYKTEENVKITEHENHQKETKELKANDNEKPKEFTEINSIEPQKIGTNNEKPIISSNDHEIKHSHDEIKHTENQKSEIDIIQKIEHKENLTHEKIEIKETESKIQTEEKEALIEKKIEITTKVIESVAIPLEDQNKLESIHQSNKIEITHENKVVEINGEIHEKDNHDKLDSTQEKKEIVINKENKVIENYPEKTEVQNTHPDIKEKQNNLEIVDKNTHEVQKQEVKPNLIEKKINSETVETKPLTLNLEKDEKVDFFKGNLNDFQSIYNLYYEKISNEQKSTFKIHKNLDLYLRGMTAKIIAIKKGDDLQTLAIVNYDSNVLDKLKLNLSHFSTISSNFESNLNNIIAFINNHLTYSELIVDIYYEKTVIIKLTLGRTRKFHIEQRNP